jgi:hypothetical protein
LEVLFKQGFRATTIDNHILAGVSLRLDRLPNAADVWVDGVHVINRDHDDIEGRRSLAAFRDLRAWSCGWSTRSDQMSDISLGESLQDGPSG